MNFVLLTRGSLGIVTAPNVTGALFVERATFWKKARGLSHGTIVLAGSVMRVYLLVSVVVGGGATKGRFWEHSPEVIAFLGNTKYLDG